MLYFSVDILVLIIKNLFMLLFVVINNKICLQYGTYKKSSYAQDIYTTITLPKSYTSKYTVVITPFDPDAGTDIDAMDVSASAVYKVNNSSFAGRVYGRSSADDPHGFLWITVGY